MASKPEVPKGWRKLGVGEDWKTADLWWNEDDWDLMIGSGKVPKGSSVFRKISTPKKGKNRGK